VEKLDYLSLLENCHFGGGSLLSYYLKNEVQLFVRFNVVYNGRIK